MKKLLLIALSAVLTATVGHAANDDIVVDGVVYEWSPNDLGYIVTGWDEETPIQSLHIRGVVNELDVVRIAESAFDPENYTDEDNPLPLFESVEIDEGITYIGENAFIDCSSIKWVRMPSTLRIIGSDAFFRCFSLEYAFLNEGLETIGERAFSNCTSLTTMVIPSTVTEIQAHAFSDCTGVTDVYFLMTDVDQLNYFNWWDGVYEPGNEEHGGMEFNTKQNTVIHVPEGMLQDYVDSEKFVAWIPLVPDDNTYPLWWIVNYGVVGRDYTVSDDLAAVYVDVDGGLYAKDDNLWLTPDEAYPGEIDYMKTTGLMSVLGNMYDQSNWVVLTNVDAPNNFKGYLIGGNTITGKLKDKKNPVIELSNEAELEKGDKSPYVPNVYIPASFMGRAQIGANDRIYAFVQPKPQEVIHVDWTVYSEDKECFYLPEPDEDNGINTMRLKGGFDVSYDLYEGDEVPTLEDCGYYAFDAINRRIVASEESNLKVENTPYTAGGVSDQFVVYPLELPDDPIPTAITEIINDFAQKDKGWYTIDGRYLGVVKPTVPGLYINGNRKVIIR